MDCRIATKLNVVLVAGFLCMLMMLKPTACRAQAEINPDHYEDSAAAVQNNGMAKRNTVESNVARAPRKVSAQPISANSKRQNAQLPKHANGAPVAARGRARKNEENQESKLSAMPPAKPSAGVGIRN